MSSLAKELNKHRKKQSFVTIRRDKIDEDSLHGFVISLSSELVLILHIYDFNLNGLMILNLRDISGVSSSKTSKLQKKMLIEDGIFASISFDSRLPLESWRNLLQAHQKSDQLVILENEADDVFLIGTIAKVGRAKASINFFTGAANWREEPEIIRLDEITCCQIGSGYLQAYERYFDRHDLWAS